MAYIGSKPADKALTGADIEDGTVQIADLAATGTKDATTFLRGDGTFAEAGGTNTPAFRAYMSSNQSISSGTATKVNLDSVTFDTNSAFDTSNYRFVVPSGQAGKYFFYSQMRKSVSASSLTLIYFYVNGSAKGYVRLTSSNQESNQISGTFDLSVGDYVEVYFYDNGTSPAILANADQYSYFTGYKIIE